MCGLGRPNSAAKNQQNRLNLARALEYLLYAFRQIKAYDEYFISKHFHLPLKPFDKEKLILTHKAFLVRLNNANISHIVILFESLYTNV